MIVRLAAVIAVTGGAANSQSKGSFEALVAKGATGYLNTSPLLFSGSRMSNRR